jgi:hypothetical protein
MFGGGGTSLPEPEPVKEQKTQIDPDRSEQIAEAARKRREIMKRRGRAALRTGDVQEGPTRSGVSVPTSG